MQHADDGFSGEAERQQTTARIEREGFRAFNADKRSQTTQLTGDVRRLALELHGILLGQIRMTEHMGAMQADAGAQARLQGQQFDDPWRGQLFLSAQQRTQQELIRLGVERGKAEEGMLHSCHFSRSRGERRGLSCGRLEQSGGGWSKLRLWLGLRGRCF